ncbi:hypothetical protein [Arthrobacter sp. MA-N2]|uniref:hypothetical protein n=1 Tax=Arthrobacter sp. MA-N2 TaxID=1101188 RepID=UPI003FA42722
MRQEILEGIEDHLRMAMASGGSDVDQALRGLGRPELVAEAALGGHETAGVQAEKQPLWKKVLVSGPDAFAAASGGFGCWRAPRGPCRAGWLDFPVEQRGLEGLGESAGNDLPSSVRDRGIVPCSAGQHVGTPFGFRRGFPCTGCISGLGGQHPTPRIPRICNSLKQPRKHTSMRGEDLPANIK